jgi:hypothetical protein
MVTLMYRAEFKIGELVALERRHYNPGDHYITVPAGKLARERQRALDRDAREAMDDWMAARRDLGVRPTGRLFCVNSQPTVGGKLDASTWRIGLRTCANRAGIDRRGHPQGIRDSGIRHRADSRERVQAQVGPYIDTEDFQAKLHPDIAPRRIGLGCREALTRLLERDRRHDVRGHLAGHCPRSASRLIGR